MFKKLRKMESGSLKVAADVLERLENEQESKDKRKNLSEVQGNFQRVEI